MRPSGRALDQLRVISLETNVNKHAEGSCLAKFGDTHVICTASVEDRVPRWLRDAGMVGSPPNTACCLVLRGTVWAEKRRGENKVGGPLKYRG